MNNLIIIELISESSVKFAMHAQMNCIKWISNLNCTNSIIIHQNLVSVSQICHERGHMVLRELPRAAT